MRILHVNKYLYRRGGAESYMQAVASLQSDAGHEVAFFGMDHPQNEPQHYERHFPSYLELEPPPAALAGKIAGFGRMVWSTSARRGMDAVVSEFQPDVVHLHNTYHHLSPSILGPLARRRIPAVMTLHDYKLACPTYRFLDKGEICQACLGGHFTQAVRRRCKDGSLASSAAMAAELAIHTAFRAYRNVQVFVCPSRFMAGRMAAAGVFPDRLRWVPHFVLPTPERSIEPSGSIVFAGRLSPEKGVDTLIEAAGRLSGRVRLDIAGDGPDRPRLEDLAARIGGDGVRFFGRVDSATVDALVTEAMAVALPSRWYENQPMIVLEAFARGVPVVASDLGGAPELVRHGVDGFLVPPDDPAALASALQALLDDRARARAMGKSARERALTEFAPDVHLARLDAVYAEAASRV
ncbi:MAG: glycosyltransferase family 4 protein [Actinobacteria bacterium]|nr:MAG: glycosyltransferase family 4 protein [Actinomycetota bacterium]